MQSGIEPRGDHVMSTRGLRAQLSSAASERVSLQNDVHRLLVLYFVRDQFLDPVVASRWPSKLLSCPMLSALSLHSVTLPQEEGLRTVGLLGELIEPCHSSATVPHHPHLSLLRVQPPSCTGPSQCDASSDITQHTMFSGSSQLTLSLLTDVVTCRN